MRLHNRFDSAIDVRFKYESWGVIRAATGRHAEDVRSAAVFVVDTLDLCKLGAEAVFESKAKPEHALEIYDRVLKLLNPIPQPCDCSVNADEPVAQIGDAEPGPPRLRTVEEILAERWGAAKKGDVNQT